MEYALLAQNKKSISNTIMHLADIRRAVRFATVEWNPREEGPPSPYMGSPTPDIDKAWEDVSQREF